MARKKKRRRRSFRLRHSTRMLLYGLVFLLSLVILTGGSLQPYLPFSVEIEVPVPQRQMSAFVESPGFSLDWLGELFEGVVGGILDFLGDGGEEGYQGRASLLEEIPEYKGDSYVWLDDPPDFTKEELERDPYEYYGPLDSLGRCTVAEAMLDPSMMPKEPREAIGAVKPTGWHTVKYDLVEDKYLYNRCHLIGFQLTGENANERNLITGTRYLNVRGMLSWENLLADYLKTVKGKCMYRVTPIYEGKNLLASGLHMEAESVGNDEIWFNIYVFNVQPGIGIDYADGDSWIL